MQLETVATADITKATALLCRDYILLPAGEDVDVVENGTMVSLVDVQVVPPTTPGRRPLCEFVLGCLDSGTLHEKVEAYEAGQLYVPPRAFDQCKKQIAAAMADARNQN